MCPRRLPREREKARAKRCSKLLITTLKLIILFAFNLFSYKEKSGIEKAGECSQFTWKQIRGVTGQQNGANGAMEPETGRHTKIIVIQKASGHINTYA